MDQPHAQLSLWQHLATPALWSAVIGAFGWATYRMMNPKPMPFRRFIGGVGFSAFVGYVVGTYLLHLGMGPNEVIAIGSTCGSVSEKLRSLLMHRLEIKLKELDHASDSHPY